MRKISELWTLAHLEVKIKNLMANLNLRVGMSMKMKNSADVQLFCSV